MHRAGLYRHGRHERGDSPDAREDEEDKDRRNDADEQPHIRRIDRWRLQ